MKSRFKRVHDSTRKRLTGRTWLAVFGLTLATVLVGINLASAVNVGGFEIDANESPQARALYAGNNAPPGDDWAQTDPAPAAGEGVFVPSAAPPHTAAADLLRVEHRQEPCRSGVRR